MSHSAREDQLVLHTRVVSGAGGGPDKTILNSPRFLEDRGYPMLCAYLRHPDDDQFPKLEERANKWGASLVAIDDKGPFDVGVLKRVNELCRQHQPAIWHGHDYKTNLLGLLARRTHPMRLITTVHGWVKHTWKTPLYYGIDRRCLPRYDQVICVSQDLYDDCVARGVPKERCWLIPNAIDTEEFRRCKTPEQAKRELGVPEGRAVIGAVGRLSEEKGFENLIEAAAQLTGKCVDLELWIAGEGDAERHLKDVSRTLGIQERVKFLGFRTDTVELYQAMDVFALSSLREGLPNVVLEAMAVEVPVVATRIAGIPNLVTDGENGLVIEPGSVSALVKGLGRVLENDDLRHTLKTAARTTIENNYSFAHRMERIRDIYDATLDLPVAA